MSAPIAVNTADGVCWTRRGALRGGEALYAPEGVCDCPPFVMATLAEVAEHGIVGSADALPMPVGPEPQQPRTVLDRARAVLGARVSKDDLQLVLGNVVTYAAELENRLAEYERPADEDPITLTLTDKAEELRPCCAGSACTCTPYSPQDDEYDVTPQVAKLRTLLAGQREQAAAETGDGEGLSGPCDCGEGAVHYTATDCPAARRSAETGGAE